MEKLRTGLVLALLAGASTSANAGPRFSIEAIAGTANQELKFDEFDLTLEDASQSAGIRLALTFNRYVGIEAGYINYGEAEDNASFFAFNATATVETSAFNTGVVGRIPVGSFLSINGRVGASLWQTEYEFSASNGIASFGEDKDDDSGIAPYYGVGIEFTIANRVRISTDYTWHRYEVELYSSPEDLTVEHLSLGVGYVF